MKIIERKQLSMDFIESLMLNRGITDIQKYINPTHENDTDLLTLPNIQQVMQIVQKNIGKSILILVDSDADGNTSAAIIYKYLKFVNPLVNLDFFIHKHKTHGLTHEFMEYVIENEPDLIIVPDAGTNDIENREKITEMGIDLIVIDHHNEDKFTSKGGILVNNHSNFPKNDINKNLTGAGMTYLVCKALDKYVFNTNKVEELKDLAMVGTIGDCASVIDNETRVMCLEALRDIKSKAIRAVIEENGQNFDEVTFNNMQWGGIIPLINSIVRVGTYEERKLMFKALADIEPDYFETVTKRKLNKETRKYEMIDFDLSIYQLAYEAAKKCRERQNKIIETEMKIADEQFNEKSGIQVYVVQTDECKPLTGLLANKLTSKWQQPVIAVWEVNGGYSGSLRGWEKTISNFKQWCENTNLFTLVQGHGNAAGVAFELDKLDEIKKCGETLEPEEFYYEVDKIYEKYANSMDIYTIHNNSHLFKNGAEEPTFAIKNMRVNTVNSRWSKNTMRIYLEDVTYIKFKTSEEEFNKLVENECTIDVIGTFSVNKWNGKEYPQFMINELEIVNTKDEREKTSVNFGIFG